MGPATQEEPEPQATSNIEPTQPLGISTQAEICRQVHEASVVSSGSVLPHQSCGAQASLGITQSFSPIPVIAAVTPKSGKPSDSSDSSSSQNSSSSSPVEQPFSAPPPEGM